MSGELEVRGAWFPWRPAGGQDSNHIRTTITFKVVFSPPAPTQLAKGYPGCFYGATSSQKRRRYSRWVLARVNAIFTSAGGPDSGSCFLFVQEMMGNREKVRTSEGCKLGKARLRTSCGYG